MSMGGYEWDGEQQKQNENYHASNSAGSFQETGQANDENRSSHTHSRDLRQEKFPAGKPEIQENSFPFTSLYRVKTPIRFMKPRSGRPRSAASNNRPDSNLRVDSKDSLGSTPSTMVSDDPRRLLDVKLSRRSARKFDF